MYKILLLTIVCVAIVSGNLQDDIKAKTSDALHQGEKLKDQVVDAVNENVETLKDKASDALKASQKVAADAKEAAGKKLDEAKQAGEGLRKKASDSFDDLKDAAGDAAKSAKKTADNVADQAKKAAENAANQASKQGEKVRRQASDAGEKVKSAAKQAEQQGETLLDKAFSVINDVKDSILETVGFASKHAAAYTDQAKEKFDEYSGKAQKTAKQTEKKVKESLDL